MKSRVAVVYGGTSSEALVSEMSAKQIITHMPSGYKAKLIEYTPCIDQDLSAFAPDVVYPAMHGVPGEDGSFQGFLETLGIPYVGSSVAASAIAIDKYLSKIIYRSLGLQTPEGWVIRSSDQRFGAYKKLSRMVFKPLNQGSAIGVKIMDTNMAEKEFESRLRPFLLEEWIQGREITAGILEINGVAVNLPIVETITPPGTFNSYDLKYRSDKKSRLIPAPLEEPMQDLVHRAALAAHLGLGCRDFSRTDFIVTDDQAYILETNTLPGMTEFSSYPAAARIFGLEFGELLDQLISNALQRVVN